MVEAAGAAVSLDAAERSGATARRRGAGMTAAETITPSAQRECPRDGGLLERWPIANDHMNDRICDRCGTWWREDAAGDLREAPGLAAGAEARR